MMFLISIPRLNLLSTFPCEGFFSEIWYDFIVLWYSIRTAFTFHNLNHSKTD